MEREEQDAAASPRRAKKRSALSIFRAAILALSECTAGAGKKGVFDLDLPPEAAVEDGTLMTLVDGVRPLHLDLQLERRRPQSPLLLPPPPPEPSFHDVCLSPPSPAWSSIDDDSMSRYASAEDLQALDAAEDEGGEPNAIDVRAEEFIASFYEQMRLQRTESVNEEAAAAISLNV